MPIVGDVLEFIDVQRLSEVSGEILNVYHYRVTQIPPGLGLSNISSYLLPEWYDGPMSVIAEIQSNQVRHVLTQVNNLNAYLTDFTVLVPSAPFLGFVNTPYIAPATAWSFRLNRSLRNTRNGSKRIAGVPDNWVLNNTVQASATEGLASVQAILSQELTFPVDESGGLITLTPVIVRKAPVVTSPPLAVNPVESALFRGVSTQATRKQLLS